METTENQNINLNFVFSKSKDQLQIKLGLQLPYHQKTVFYNGINDLIIYECEFYRCSAKVFENDTLTSSFTKENVSRENVFQLMNKVSENYDKSHNTPIKNINELLKSLSKIFTKSDFKFAFQVGLKKSNLIINYTHCNYSFANSLAPFHPPQV